MIAITFREMSNFIFCSFWWSGSWCLGVDTTLTVGMRNTVVPISMAENRLLNAQGGIKADSAFAFMLSVFAKFLLGSFDAQSISDKGSNL